MRHDVGSKRVAALGFAAAGALLLAVASCQSEARYVRDAADCTCMKTMGNCMCNHCSGEKGSKCYCASGGCQCGGHEKMCQCGHCTGLAGEPNCDCKAPATKPPA